MSWHAAVIRRTGAGVAVGAALLVATGVQFPLSGRAQESTATPDLPQPPPEVLHCARPFAESIIPDISAPESFAAILDSASGRATLLIPDLPADATCYVIFKTPSDSNPIALEWAAEGVTAPGELVDTGGFPSAGTYCYELIVANLSGRSEGVERCVDVPPGLAPTATPTVAPSITPTSPGLPGPVSSPTSPPAPAPPDVGSGRASGGDSSGGGLFGWVLLMVMLAGSAGFAILRLRHSE